MEALEDAASPGMRTGILAARTLERACRGHEPPPGDARLGLYLDSVQDLARSLGQELSALSQSAGSGTQGLTPPGTGGSSTSLGSSGSLATALVSAALRAADLATLAACAAPELPPESAAYLRAIEASRLAAASAQSMVLEHRALRPPGSSEEPGDYESYERRDLRGAEWRAGLVSRQIEDMLQEKD